MQVGRMNKADFFALLTSAICSDHSLEHLIIDFNHNCIEHNDVNTDLLLTEARSMTKTKLLINI